MIRDRDIGDENDARVAVIAGTRAERIAAIDAITAAGGRPAISLERPHEVRDLGPRHQSDPELTAQPKALPA